MAETQAQQSLRGENVNRAVKGFAMKKMKMMQVLLNQTSNKWQETYYRETATPLAGGTGSDIAGVPRGAQFPHVNPSWTEQTGRHLKHAGESTVFMEDKLTDNIDVQARTLIRVAEAIAESVDQHIYTQLTGATGIGTAAAAGTGWDAAVESTRKPISDLLKGRQNMKENQYDVDNLYILLNPHDYRALMENSKVINNPSFKTADVVSNGVVGQIVSGNIIESTSVDDDEAMMIIGQRAATWRMAVAQTTVVIEDPGIKFTIRSWLIGQIQITDPKAIYVITDTEE